MKPLPFRLTDSQHRDHVPEVPPGFSLLASTSRYPVHSMIRYHPSSTPSDPIPQILTIQGHPEFTPSIVSHMVDARSATGLFDPNTTTEARRRLGGKGGTGSEGYHRVGWSIWRVMLQLPTISVKNGTIGGPRSTFSSNGGSKRNLDDYVRDQGRYAHIGKVLDRRGPWTAEEFQGGSTVSQIQHVSVLSGPLS